MKAVLIEVTLGITAEEDADAAILQATAEKAVSAALASGTAAIVAHGCELMAVEAVELTEV